VSGNESINTRASCHTVRLGYHPRVAIDTNAAAQRLARAMMLSELFHERVTPELHALFEREVMAFDFCASAAPAGLRSSGW
jgi:hypothetical protein